MLNLSWCWENWRTLWPAPWGYVALSFVAVACGLFVGTERQRREKPAGLRTLALVCLGSAVFTMVSFAFASTTADSGRVAAQIVTGIGFLGAGVILHARGRVSGTTTAAMIWMTAAIGMTVGAGFALAGLALSLLVNRLITLIFLYETRWHPDLRQVCVEIDYAPKNGMTRIRLERALVEYHLRGARSVWSEPSPELFRLTLHLDLAPVHLYELLNELIDIPEVFSLKHETCPLPDRTTPSS